MQILNLYSCTGFHIHSTAFAAVRMRHSVLEVLLLFSVKSFSQRLLISLLTDLIAVKTTVDLCPGVTQAALSLSLCAHRGITVMTY